MPAAVGRVEWPLTAVGPYCLTHVLKKHLLGILQIIRQKRSAHLPGRHAFLTL